MVGALSTGASTTAPDGKPSFTFDLPSGSAVIGTMAGLGAVVGAAAGGPGGRAATAALGAVGGAAFAASLVGTNVVLSATL